MIEDATQPLAFPSESRSMGGMTLRDWFAGQALASITLRSWDHLGEGETLIKEWARTCYACADAMLEARK